MVPREPRKRWWVPRSRTLLLTTAIIGLAFAVGIPLMPHSPVEVVLFDLVLLNAAPVVASVLCLRAARRVPRERLIWWGAAAGSLLNVAGNLAYALAVAPLADEPFPSVADALWLASYPALFLVAAGLLRSRVPRPQARIWLDGLIGALGVTAVAATVFLTPALSAPHLDGLATAANLAYPVADVLLLALLGAVPAVLGARIDRVVAVLCLILTSKLVGDVLVARAQAGDGYEPGGLIDLCWMANAVLTAAAATAARPRRYGRISRTAVGWQALVVPLGCTVAALAVLGAEWGDGALGVGEALALGCVLASLARTALTFSELRSLQEARRQAGTDHLTGLPNRRALAAQMDALTRDGRPAALILLDLDGFKAVNDGLGHDAGDELLRRLGDRLRPALRPEDVLFRLGGDEFAVLLPDAPADAAEDCARRIHDLVCRPVQLDGVPVQVGASLGIAVTPDQAATIEDLLRCADRAMYAAKAARGGVRWFAAEEDATAPGGGAEPPQVAASPLVFRPLVADDGVAAVVALHRPGPAGRPTVADLSALDEALGAVARWWASSPVPVQLAITPADLRSPRLPDRVAAGLLRAGLPADSLLLKLDRAALSAVPEEIPSLLAALRSRGIPTVVELHGSSALALARLRDLPADRIALDPEVAAEVVTDSRTSLVVGHTVALARALGSGVYADSSDARTDASLTRLGCTVLRTPSGPLPADAVELWLSEQVAGAPGMPVR